MSDSATAGQILQKFVGTPPLLSQALVDALADRPWDVAANARAATLLHLQLESRVSTQNLSYSSGSEASALGSLHALFERTRVICEQEVDARLFHELAWHVLNIHVRPFTSRWHRRQGLGRLSALDDTDDFRLELAALTRILRRFDHLLLELRGEKTDENVAEQIDWIGDEVVRPLPWGLAIDSAGSTEEHNAPPLVARHRAEHAAIKLRRERYGIETPIDRASGLALSGGGIRSATFALGVVSALARRGLLPQLDYLSTVSGGGYLGSFLTGLLSEPGAQATSTSDQAAERAAVRAPFLPGDRESPLLGHIRQNCRYLASASLGERLLVAGAQIGGLLTNLLALAALLFLSGALVLVLEGAWALVSKSIQTSLGVSDPGSAAMAVAAGLAATGLLTSQVVAAKTDSDSAIADRTLSWSALPLAIIGLLVVFDGMRSAFAALVGLGPFAECAALVMPLLALLAGLALERTVAKVALIGRWVARLAAPMFLVALFLGSDRLLVTDADLRPWAVLAAVVVSAWLSFMLNLNFTGLHRHYRRRLGETFIIQPKGEDDVETVTRQLSDLARSGRGPYPILNAALNVPRSRLPAMRGRLTDFFSFTPDFCGSPITGYWATRRIEAANPTLDLAVAMAISGAAVSPRMGLQDRPGLGFWLSLMNVRLGYWLRKPPKAEQPQSRWRPPALRYLLKELVGAIDEKSTFINLSDGGHIENLGIYELLRRRCKLIVAVDGEQDPRMTFHAVANLQRLAAIDLGVQIDMDLDDLRLDDRGFSRSHFQFCRIRYGNGEIGYMIYLKLSLTGNEGEFLRRFRLDEPAFPHHPTADQNFTEARFEAYRSLGQHVGERLFVESIVGALAHDDVVDIDAWFCAMGRSFLDPLPAGGQA